MFKARCLPCILACVLLLITNLSYASNISSVRVWPAPDSTRVVFDLSAKPEFTYFTLSNPERLVIDFKNSKNTAKLTGLAANDTRIKKIRTSTAKSKTSTRLVLELNNKFNLSLFALAPAGQYGDRLVVDLKDKPNQTVAKSTPASTTKTSSQSNNQARDIVIAINAGHGGKDPGSIGPRGTYEKNVTLQIAKKLQSLINREKGMQAVVIRNGDYYVHPNDITEIARKKEVDFLVSIHADAYHTSQPNGGSVWVVSSRRAQSEMSKWLDNRQRNSELLGGGGDVIKNTKDDNLGLNVSRYEP